MNRLIINCELSHTDQPVMDVRYMRKDAFQTVPYSVHWSDYKAGKLPHPYYQKSSTQYRRIDEKALHYKKSIPILVSVQRSLLILSFKGGDYFVKVWVNGRLAGVHEGMFGEPSEKMSRYVKFNQMGYIMVEVLAVVAGNNYDGRVPAESQNIAFDVLCREPEIW